MRVMFLMANWVVDPLGVGYLSAALKSAGHQTAIAKTDGEDELIDRIDQFQPNVLAYSVTTGWHRYYQELNLRLQELYLQTISVFGGPHPTFFPEMSEGEGVDVIVQGEAEKSMVRLMDRLGQEWDRIKNAGVYIVRPEKLEPDIDTIEFPDRDLMYSYPENRDNPIRNVMLSRGCPFACTYCYNGTWKKMYPGQKTFRCRSPENVIEELEQVVDEWPQTRLIFFQDDEFIMDEDRLGAFVDMYRGSVGLPFHCQLRADLMTTDKVRLLKDAGCVSVTFAAETGNDLIRERMLKRKMSKEHLTNCAVMLRNAGIRFRIENMVGLPGETLDEALETLDLNIECQPDVAFCSLYQPYPKTPLGDLCKDMLIWDGDVDDIPPSFFDESSIKRDTARQFNNLQKLFGIVVELPFLRPFVRVLIQMPRMKLLAWISTKFRRWAYDSRLYKVA